MKQFAFILATFFCTVMAYAADSTPYNLVNMDVTASSKVANDQMHTVISVTKSGKTVAELTNDVNRRATKILNIQNHYAAVSAQTDNYYTRPNYKDGEIISWRVSQQITLTSHDFKQMNNLLGKITELGSIHSMQFTVSDPLARKTKQTLLQQAIKQFKDKASVIAKQFGMAGYKLVSLTVDRSAPSPGPLGRVYLMGESRNKSRSAPALAAGTNEVRVHLQGTIQLKAAKP